MACSGVRGGSGCDVVIAHARTKVSTAAAQAMRLGLKQEMRRVEFGKLAIGSQLLDRASGGCGNHAVFAGTQIEHWQFDTSKLFPVVHGQHRRNTRTDSGW